MTDATESNRQVIRAAARMLDRFPLNPILPAADGARAEAFYRDVLGLQQLSPPGADPMAFGAGNGTMIVLSELRDRTPPPYPVVAFLVEGIEDLVAGLRERGVEFVDPQPASFAGDRGRHRRLRHRLRAGQVDVAARQRGQRPRPQRADRRRPAADALPRQRRLRPRRDRPDRRPQPRQVMAGVERGEDEADGREVVDRQALGGQVGVARGRRVEDLAVLGAALVPALRGRRSVGEAVALGRGRRAGRSRSSRARPPRSRGGRGRRGGARAARGGRRRACSGPSGPCSPRARRCPST